MTTKTDITLLPCPFCGGEAEMDTRQGYLALGTGRLGNRIAVYCRSCNADMGVCIEDVPDIEPEQVANMWNRRAAVEADRQGRMPSAPQDLLDMLDTLCTGLEWNIENHPAIMNESDSEALTEARALLSRHSSDRPAEVRCNHCGWLGADVDLVRDVAADEPDDGAADVCPRCKRIGDLQDIGQPAASAVRPPICRISGVSQDVFERAARRLAQHSDPAAPVAQEPVLGRINWPTMPSRKGQSPVLFDDGYAEGWAKCMSECQKAVAAQAQPSGDVDGLTAVYDAFGIGSAARTQETLLASIENAIRRSRCLSAIERVLTVETPPDPDEGDDEPGEECLLRWGADSEGYAEHFQAALKKFGYTLAPVAAQAQPVVPAAWKGIALDAIRRMRAGHVNCMDIIDMAEKLLEAERGAFTRAAKGE